MASEQQAVFTWNANSESDLANYLLQAGRMDLAGFVGEVSDTVTGTTKTYTPANGGTDLSMIPHDGVRWFRLFARDTSGNLSTPTAPVSKRIIRVANKIRVRK